MPTAIYMHNFETKFSWVHQCLPNPPPFGTSARFAVERKLKVRLPRGEAIKASRGSHAWVAEFTSRRYHVDNLAVTVTHNRNNGYICLCFHLFASPNRNKHVDTEAHTDLPSSF